MLQSNNAQSAIDRERAGPEIISGADALQGFVGLVRRRFFVIFFVALLTISLGLIYCVTVRSSFTAQAQLLIDARKLQVFQQQSILGDIPVDTAQVQADGLKERFERKAPQWAGHPAQLVHAVGEPPSRHRRHWH